MSIARLKRKIVEGGESLLTAPSPIQTYLKAVLAYDGDLCILWPFRSNGYAYGLIRTGKKQPQQYVHRYVCEKVNGPPPSSKHQAAHICGNGSQNCITPKHIVWKTAKENSADRIEHGRSKAPEFHVSKITPDDVRTIRELVKHTPRRVLAKQFNVSTYTISEIKRNKTWKWVK